MDRFSRTTCADYDVYERPDEVEARTRRQRAKNPNAPVDGARKKVEFNTNKTYKYHATSHYPEYIRTHGPLDNYSTQTVSAHSNLYNSLSLCSTNAILLLELFVQLLMYAHAGRT